MFENIMGFFKKLNKKTEQIDSKTNKDEAKERLHLVLMQDRANVSADFLDMMRQEIIDVIKKYIDVDEKEIDVRLTNKQNSDGTTGAPALYANIPIISIKNDKKNVAYGSKTSKNSEQNVDSTLQKMSKEENTKEIEQIKNNEEEIDNTNLNSVIEDTNEKIENEVNQLSNENEMSTENSEDANTDLNTEKENIEITETTNQKVEDDKNSDNTAPSKKASTTTNSTKNSKKNKSKAKKSNKKK